MRTFDPMKQINSIKKSANPDNLGMILVHNGIVRAKSKDGKRVNRLKVTYDKNQLDKLIASVKSKDFVEDCVIWINEGNLSVGDDIMWVILAGNYRDKLLPLLTEIIETIKTQIVSEVEL